MRPRQVDKTTVACINQIQTNHHRQVITELIKVNQCVATLKMLVVMEGNTWMGCTGLAREKIGSPQLISVTKQINHQTGDGTIADDLLGQRKPGVKVAGVLIHCGRINQALQSARRRCRQGKRANQPCAVELVSEIRRGS